MACELLLGILVNSSKMGSFISFHSTLIVQSKLRFLLLVCKNQWVLNLQLKQARVQTILSPLDCLPLFPILQGLHLGLVVVLNVLLCSSNPLFCRTRRGVIHRGLSWILSMAGSHCRRLRFVPRLELLEPTSRRIHPHSQWRHLWNQTSLLS
jgi:hypothetical protein